MIPNFYEWLELNEKKLTTAGREKIKSKNFALPKERSYPIHDKAHARNALSRVSQFGSSEEKKKVRAKVHAKYPNIGDKKEDEGKEKGEK